MCFIVFIPLTREVDFAAGKRRRERNVRAGGTVRRHRGTRKADTGQKISSLHALSARIRCASARAKKDRQMTVLFVFLFLFFFFDGDGDAEVGKLKVIDRGGALGHRFGRVLHFRIGNHVTKRLRLQHLHAKPVKP